MMRFMKAGLLIGVVSLLGSCMKDSAVEDVPPPGTSVPAGSLDRMEWGNGLTGYFDYNTDSTLRTIQYNLGGSSAKTIFERTQGRLSTIADDASLYRNVYNYNLDNQLVFVENVQKSNNASQFRLEYTYNAQGLVDSMKYFSTNGGTKTLRTRSGYQYDAAGMLLSVETESGNNMVLSQIEAWSPEISFMPEMYYDVLLTENYDIYNLPVLSQRKMLPSKITRKVKPTTGGTYTTDKTQQITFTVSGKKVTKTTTEVSFPNVPGSNTSLTANYVYR
ncbi:MAG: hypothetical protein EOO09_06935 [Chitinophagaceae bacterium]|nr:MAG: hypothetical protein EOO09_06935 [Chitinophagaceae bacterium]